MSFSRGRQRSRSVYEGPSVPPRSIYLIGQKPELGMTSQTSCQDSDYKVVGVNKWNTTGASALFTHGTAIVESTRGCEDPRTFRVRNLTHNCGSSVVLWLSTSISKKHDYWHLGDKPVIIYSCQGGLLLGLG